MVEARERESEASIDAGVEQARALRAECSDVLKATAKLFEKAVPQLERMASIAEELRAIGFRLDQVGRPQPALVDHPNNVLRPLSDPFEYVAVLPPLERGGPAFSRHKNEGWFRTDPAAARAGHEPVGEGLPVGVYDENGVVVGDQPHWARQKMARK